MVEPSQQTPEMRSIAEAAAWRARLAEAGEETNADFETWLCERDANKLAWRRITTSWDYFGDHATSPELIEVRQAALADARAHLKQRLSKGMDRKIAGGLAATCVVVGAVIAVVALRNGSENYSTGRGEYRTVVLADGSRLMLDSETDVQVHYTKYARRLTLLYGRAHFDDTHNVLRPFLVIAGNKKVVATGTAFDVGLLDHAVTVTLIKGGVSVMDKDCCADNSYPITHAVQMQAGEQLIASAGRKVVVRNINLKQVTAWERGEIVFQNTPLTEVVQSMNRYSAHPIVIADQNVSALRLSGVFKTSDINGFVETLTDYLPVTSSVAQDGTIKLRARR